MGGGGANRVGGCAPYPPPPYPLWLEPCIHVQVCQAMSDLMDEAGAMDLLWCPLAPWQESSACMTCALVIHALLACQDATGHHNLCRINSAACSLYSFFNSLKLMSRYFSVLTVPFYAYCNNHIQYRYICPQFLYSPDRTRHVCLFSSSCVLLLLSSSLLLNSLFSRWHHRQ